MTHDQSEAFAVSDTVLVMNKGHIMQIGSPQDLYRQPASLFMASFNGRRQLVPAAFSEDFVDIYGYRLLATAAFRPPRAKVASAYVRRRLP